MTSSVRLGAASARLRAQDVLTYQNNRPAFSDGLPSEVGTPSNPISASEIAVGARLAPSGLAARTPPTPRLRVRPLRFGVNSSNHQRDPGKRESLK